jgi:hypothetical protein
MKKNSLLLLFMLLVGTGLVIQAQVVNQDAEGKSTIVFPGGVIDIEPGKTALTFSFMNIPDFSKDKGFLWGITARAENKSGIGKLFESGKVVPGGFVSVTAGYSETLDPNKENACYGRWMVYARIGASAGKFNLYTQTDSTNLKDQLKEIYYNGLSFQFGMNLQLGGVLLLGLTTGIQEANNLGTLSKQEFILTTTQTSENQKLVKEEKITAYSGDFQEFDRFDIDADVVGFFKLGKSHVMTPYGYFRWRFPLGDEHTFPNLMNAGLGVNFFTNKGNHLGGLFLELPDITNELKKDRELLNRLTLGITFKISFSKSGLWTHWFK